MPSRTNTFRQVTRVYVSHELSPAAQAARLISAAHAGVDDLIASGRASPRYTEYVDGVADGDESSVRSTLAFRFNHLADVVAFALAFLARRSPVLTGRFSTSFMVSVDGSPTPGASLDLTTIPAGAEVVIYNPEPYSRKIDVQFVGNKRLRFSVPPGLFTDTAAACRQRFGNTVTVQRITDVRFPGQATQTRGPNRGRLVSSPALLIRAI